LSYINDKPDTIGMPPVVSGERAVYTSKYMLLFRIYQGWNLEVSKW